MTNSEMFYLAKQAVVNYFNENYDDFAITQDNVFIVWFCKTVQNWKAMVSTDVHDGMYYEVTYDGDARRIYLDAYKKWQKKVLDVVSSDVNTLTHEEPENTHTDVDTAKDSVLEGGEEDNSFQEESEETTDEELEGNTKAEEEV